MEYFQTTIGTYFWQKQPWYRENPYLQELTDMKLIRLIKFKRKERLKRYSDIGCTFLYRYLAEAGSLEKKNMKEKVTLLAPPWSYCACNIR